ncbi:MAG: hypothetical protein ACFFAA_13265, partial [Promethearchaeota archaeon]
MHAIKKPVLEEPLKEEPFVTTPAITIPPEEEKIEEEKVVEVPKSSALSSQFDNIINNLDKMTGTEIALALERFQNEYVKSEGYNSVLKNVHNASTELKSNPETLSRPEVDELKLSLKIWRQKLNF